ncbi:MAG: Ig-like domain-containing protein, partial [Clostridia bacterium]|nr:Ig-like domain-containing protein [Clostridia bacterium]
MLRFLKRTLTFILLLLILVTCLPQLSFATSRDGSKGWAHLIYIDYMSISINRGEAFQLTALPEVPGDISWMSSNPSIATVTQYGLVVGVSAGTTYINVSVDTNEPGIAVARCLVTVSSSGIIEDAVYFLENVSSGK